MRYLLFGDKMRWGWGSRVSLLIIKQTGLKMKGMDELPHSRDISGFRGASVFRLDLRIPRGRRCCPLWNQEGRRLGCSGWRGRGEAEADG